MRSAASTLFATALVTAACGSVPAPEPALAVPDVEIAAVPVGERAVQPKSVEPLAADGAGGAMSCRCDVIGFESDGPPQGDCSLAFDADGIGTLKGTTSRPPFKARLVPIPGKKKNVDYLFEGEFDFACSERWCGHHELSVLAVAEHDYRVTVARSDEGPPSHVLWVTCS